MKNYKILFKLATRGRPSKALAAIDNILKLASDNYEILVSIDEDDLTMNNKATIDALVHPKVKHFLGESKNKIHAINRDVERVEDWDVLVNTSDDMVFVENGFDNDIRAAFGDDLDRCVHFPDGNQNEKIITMSIIGRPYYNRFGYIYHPDYISLWCDNEQTDVARGLNKYVYVNKMLFRHMHPAWGLATMDEQYRKTESFFNVDKAVYEARKIRGFPI